MSERRLGIAVLAIGAVAIFAVQRIAPLLEPPLYDGVVVAEPYRWLVPPPGRVGDPTSASGTAKLEGGGSPLIALATTESPPQAQIFATPGALVVPDGTTEISMSIQPVPPASLPTDGHIAGNVYRMSIANQAGSPLTAPESARVTVVLRGPEEEPDATVEQLGPEGWTPLPTKDAGFGSTHLAVVTGFGDFALVAAGPSGPYPTATAVTSVSGSSVASSAASASTSGGAPSNSPSSGIGPLGSAGPPSSSETGSGGAGPPIALLAAVVALALLGILGLLGLNGRRRQARRDRRYRGAKPRQR